VAGRDASLGDAERPAPAAAVYKSTDGGATWNRLGPALTETADRRIEGLPRSPLGKIDVAVAPSDSSRVYALIQRRIKDRFGDRTTGARAGVS